ncbi:UPF0481 protein At3g47200-like [Miscanthus floridulus]|uniref:UPF0481 protein At3g47200-like n=1 Tax=Miscanthus floridulus TaxID=154761 RepID=UPI0034579F8D
MDASSNAGTKTILIRDGPTHEIVLAIDERTATANERLKAQFSKVDTKIHRFPRGLHGIGGDSDRYIVPSVVAIGPYHHGLPHLQKMEEVKLAAAYHLYKHSGRSTSMEVYEKILSVVSDARGCYDADDPSLAGLSDADLATMMFLDGCFLLQYMVGGGDEPVLQNRMTLSTGPSIQRDIFLLENQIPWLVLVVLTEFMNVDVRRFVSGMQEKFQPGKGKEKVRCWMHCGSTPMPDERGPAGQRDRGVNTGSDADDYTPPHLLGLLWYTQIGSMPANVKNYRGIVSSLKSSSAAELAEIGVKLTPSTKAWFGDMSFQYRRRLFGKLSLSPVFLNDITACWLVNIAALEASTSGASRESDGYTVSSYLSVLAMLMDREEDVQKLRAKKLLYSTFSDKQALHFFKGLAQHLRFGDRYFSILEAIYSYRRRCSVLIFIHRHLYNGYKAMTIATLFSIVGVLVGIFKTMLSNKKQ